MDYEFERPRGEDFKMLESDTMIEIEKPVEVVRFAEGLGYGEGSISGKELRAEAGVEIVNAVESIIENPNEILVDVGTDSEGNMLDDDGCGDGRGIAKIFHKGKELLTAMNRHRAKIFGGGVTMSSSILIGTGLAKLKGENNLKSIFKAGISLLQDKGIGYGAHTDTHAAHEDIQLKAENPHACNPNCGCGAIDKAPVIIRNAVKYREEITGSINAIGVEALGISTDGLESVLDEFETFAADMDDSDYTGTDVKKDVQANGKVTKRLADGHREGYLILNLVKGKTVDQGKIREVSGDLLQAFAVDVWRMIDIADRTFTNDGVIDTEQRDRAFLSQLVYTLATSPTLTKGDQAVYVVREQAAA